jgi:chemotaxis protein CheX
MNPDDNSLAQIAEAVFETMLGIEIAPAEQIWEPNPEGVIALVKLTGTWNGAVTLETTKDQACDFTGAFLSLPAPDAVDGDVRDVMGELANMIGGNLKSTMAHGAHLSAPQVMAGADAETHPGAVNRQAFSGAECGTFWVARITAEKTLDDALPFAQHQLDEVQQNGQPHKAGPEPQRGFDIFPARIEKV